MKISVVSPVYRAEKIVPELVRRIKETMESLPHTYEIVLVEDGSPDKSWQVIEEACKEHPEVVGIKLSRNFGQHYAITAGLAESIGDVVIVMDCDLQDDPKYIPELLEGQDRGAEIIYTEKTSRKHSWFKNLTAQLFNQVFNYLIDNKHWKASGAIGSYSLLSRKAVNAYLEIKDYRRHYLMVLRWLGFPSHTIQIEHSARFEGKSSYTFSKLVQHALDGITSQSDKLLRLTMFAGFVLSALAFVVAVIVVLLTIYSGFSAGWPSLFVLILFIGGLIISSIGISGLYIGKIFEQTKNRPLYLIDKKINK